MFSYDSRRPQGFDWGLFLAGILSIVVSLYLMHNPASALKGIVLVFALLSIMQGIISISNFTKFRAIFSNTWVNLVIGILDIIVGILFLFYNDLGALSLSVLLGVWFLMDAISGMILSWHLRSFNLVGVSIVSLLLNLGAFLAGLGILINPLVGIFTIIYLVATYLLIVGINEVMIAWLNR